MSAPFDADGWSAAESVLEALAEERSACECGSLLVNGVQKYCVRCEEPACPRCLLSHKCPAGSR